MHSPPSVRGGGSAPLLRGGPVHVPVGALGQPRREPLHIQLMVPMPLHQCLGGAAPGEGGQAPRGATCQSTRCLQGPCLVEAWVTWRGVSDGLAETAQGDRPGLAQEALRDHESLPTAQAQREGLQEGGELGAAQQAVARDVVERKRLDPVAAGPWPAQQGTARACQEHLRLVPRLRPGRRWHLRTTPEVLPTRRRGCDCGCHGRGTPRRGNAALAAELVQRAGRRPRGRGLEPAAGRRGGRGGRGRPPEVGKGRQRGSHCAARGRLLRGRRGCRGRRPTHRRVGAQRQFLLRILLARPWRGRRLRRSAGSVERLRRGRWRHIESHGRGG
mmetsp:Transcript_2535/g.7617  ORF Transcript_2535/g.7617 Transcript_2535/m.7617 type:complete len:330 (+) Transcript_2535:130-1119(+)